MIGHEEGVEPAALQRLGVLDQRLEVEVGIGRAAGIAPGGGVDADRAHEGAEPELLLGHIDYLAINRPHRKAARTRRANSTNYLFTRSPGASCPCPPPAPSPAPP